ncbi:MAG: hypothetical protein GYB65_20105 [Chloroflexi bacterium]|nr:hypothetical protein [Chloroflexota bacterium]
MPPVATLLRRQHSAGRQYWTGAVLVLLLSAALRLWDLGQSDLWTDEILTAGRVHGSLADLYESLLDVGNQAPLYYLLMRLFPRDGDFLLRLPSALLGVINVALLMGVVRGVYGERALALQAGLLLAVNPLHILLSAQARYYTLLFGLALLGSYLFLRLLRGKRSRSIWTAFVLVHLLAYQTHYTALTLAAAQGALLVWFWLQSRWRILPRTDNLRDTSLIRPWFKAQLAAGLPFAVWIVVIVSGFEPSGYPYEVQRVTGSDLPVSLLNLLTGWHGDVWRWFLLPGLLTAGIGLALGLYAVVRCWQPEDVYWCIVVGGPVVAMFALNWLKGVQYRDRYFLVAAYGLVIVFLVGWRRFPSMVRWGAVGVVALTATYLIVYTYHTGAQQRTDWTGTAAFVMKQSQPGDRVLFEREMTRDAFARYFDGDEAVLRGALVLVGNEDRVAAFRADAARLWVVYRTRSEDLHRQGWLEDSDPLQTGLSPLSDWLVENQARITNTYTFDGVTIFLLAE